MNEDRARGMNENQGYNFGQTQQRASWMSKKVNENLCDFGRRLAELRKAAGYTQTQLADEIGATRRMIAYYESESQHPPANILVDLSKALNITTDELLGITPKRKIKQPDTRLQRRMQAIEKMGADKKRQILQIIDTFIEAEHLKQRI